jgi:hypothetical protein
LQTLRKFRRARVIACGLFFGCRAWALGLPIQKVTLKLQLFFFPEFSVFRFFFEVSL